MEPEVRDEFIEAINEAFRRVGANGYEEGMAQIIRWLHGLIHVAEMARTKESLAVALDLLPEIAGGQEPYAIALGRFWPELLAMSVADIAQMMMQDFGTGRGGRPAIKHSEKIGIINEMSALIKQGYSTFVAKKAVSRKFKVSESFAEKTWQKRAKIQEQNVAVTVQEAKDWFRSVMAGEIDSMKLKPGLQSLSPAVLLQNSKTRNE